MADNQTDILSPVKKRCAINAVKWVFSNAAIGLAPLFWLMIWNPHVTQKDGEIAKEISHHLKSGLILFVCCALTGAVLIDILIEKVVFRKLLSFFLNTFPFLFILLVCFVYLLKTLGVMSHAIFTSVTFFYVVVIVVTLAYCVVGKYHLYLNNEKNAMNLVSE